MDWAFKSAASAAVFIKDLMEKNAKLQVVKNKVVIANENLHSLLDKDDVIMKSQAEENASLFAVIRDISSDGATDEEKEELKAENEQLNAKSEQLQQELNVSNENYETLEESSQEQIADLHAQLAQNEGHVAALLEELTKRNNAMEELAAFMGNVDIDEDRRLNKPKVETKADVKEQEDRTQAMCPRAMIGVKCSDKRCTLMHKKRVMV
ncbi:hypothetical protein BU23DRAFT_569000 [Bimuria novae-zelandiae CBS 107.79]|uniref:C3H1-type domain-containing protein n=1 Tax=Bimuria novae-zelandiae CBS 107.79 TaxID=1447943 RepID=A0A6A5V8V8_9PLEO|nr:hypothetical protein BU23DRAFT_569000 [Bimuria novae-zelandiae CBS 107.79]